MPDSADLPHLLDLLEDDNPVVREGVRSALAGFGSGLVEAIQGSDVAVRDEQWACLDALGLPTDTDRFSRSWSQWLESHAEGTSADAVLLEQALGLLAWQISGNSEAPNQLSSGLDRLAARYSRTLEERGQIAGEVSLASFLFESMGFKGDPEDYYSPANSDLVALLDRRLGNPISLCCLFMLTGARVGLAIAGCNFPGHFLAAIEVDDKTLFVDCFNGGRIITSRDLVESGAGRLWNSHGDTRTSTIVLRTLLNIANAYRHCGEHQRMRQFETLAEDLA